MPQPPAARGGAWPLVPAAGELTPPPETVAAPAGLGDDDVAPLAQTASPAAPSLGGRLPIGRAPPADEGGLAAAAVAAQAATPPLTPPSGSWEEHLAVPLAPAARAVVPAAVARPAAPTPQPALPAPGTGGDPVTGSDTSHLWPWVPPHRTPRQHKPADDSDETVAFLESLLDSHMLRLQVLANAPSTLGGSLNAPSSDTSRGDPSDQAAGQPAAVPSPVKQPGSSGSGSRTGSSRRAALEAAAAPNPAAAKGPTSEVQLEELLPVPEQGGAGSSQQRAAELQPSAAGTLASLASAAAAAAAPPTGSRAQQQQLTLPEWGSLSILSSADVGLPQQPPPQQQPPPLPAGSAVGTGGRSPQAPGPGSASGLGADVLAHNPEALLGSAGGQPGPSGAAPPQPPPPDAPGPGPGPVPSHASPTSSSLELQLEVLEDALELTADVSDMAECCRRHLKCLWTGTHRKEGRGATLTPSCSRRCTARVRRVAVGEWMGWSPRQRGGGRGAVLCVRRGAPERDAGPDACRGVRGKGGRGVCVRDPERT